MPSRGRAKTCEQEVADPFGGYRVALSGGNSGGTRADVDLGPKGELFIEVKNVKDLVAVTTSHLKKVTARAKKGGRIPKLVFYKPEEERGEELIVVPLAMFHRLYEGDLAHVEYVMLPKRSAVFSLMQKTAEIAAAEGRIPALAFKLSTYKGGILIVRRLNGLRPFYDAYQNRHKTRELLNRTRPQKLRRELEY